jgi:hypothetical protein
MASVIEALGPVVHSGMAPAGEPLPADDLPYPQVELVGEDGEPLETVWHRPQIGLLIEITCSLFEGHDAFAGGNHFIYFRVEQARHKDYRGPDYFYVSGVPRHRPRDYWAVWEAGGKYPNVIVELASPTTIHIDRCPPRPRRASSKPSRSGCEPRRPNSGLRWPNSSSTSRARGRKPNDSVPMNWRPSWPV